MIIKEIHVDGFGIFNNFSLKGFRKGINLLVGDNEAGKSTLLKFIRFTLFGYPRSVEDRMLPLRGGNHGGRIKTILSSGKEVTFERMDSKKIRLFYDNRESQNESEWIQLLGNATGDLFNNVYAITLDELTGLQSLTQSGVEDKIFSVGLGLGGTSIGEIEKSFQEKADDIYTSRGKKQLIPTLINNIEEKKKQIRDIQENLPKYQQLTGEISQLETEVNKLAAQMGGLRGEKNKLDNYLRCYGSFIDYTKAVGELKTLPPLRDYPEKGIENLEKLEEKERVIDERIKELKDGSDTEKGIEELKNEIGGIAYNNALLNSGQNVEFLRSNLEKYKATLKEKEEDEQKTEKLTDTIQQNIENINSSWNEDTVKTFGDLLVHKNRVEKFKKDFENLQGQKTELEAEIKAMNSRESAVIVKNIFSLIAAVFFVVSAPAFYYGYHIAGAAAIIIAFLLFLGKNYLVKKPGTSQAHLKLNELQEKEKQLKTEYENYLKDGLKLPGTLSPAAAMEAMKTVEDLKNKIAERDDLLTKIEKNRLPFIREFEEKTDSLAKLIQIDWENEITERAKQVIREYDIAKEKHDLKNRLKEELERKTRKLYAAEKELKNILSEIEKLIGSIGAADAGDFRKKYEDNEKSKDLIRQKEDAVRTIETIAGIDKSGEVIEYLKPHEKETIEEKLRETETTIADLEKEHTEKAESLGKNKNELKRIEGESELASALTGLETEIQRLNNACREWLANKLAMKVLVKVKTKYEQEKQQSSISAKSPKIVTRGLGFRSMTRMFPFLMKKKR